MNAGRAEEPAGGRPRRGLPRPAEVVLAFSALVLVAPVLLLAALAVRLSSAGPVFFSQERIGLGGLPFWLRKLRTMRAGAAGAGITSRGDPRITRIGAVLRKTKIDELPELWNVLRGDMSLVGPRPEIRRYVDPANPLWQMVFQVRPGLTDPVTLRLRNEEALMAEAGDGWEDFYLHVLQPYKLAGYCSYLRRRSAFTDLGVLLRTGAAIVGLAHRLPPDAQQLRDAAHS